MTDADLRTALGARAGFAASDRRERQRSRRGDEAGSAPHAADHQLRHRRGRRRVHGRGPIALRRHPDEAGRHAIAGAGAARPATSSRRSSSRRRKPETYQIKQPGKLVLTRFDKQTLAGTFTFTADSRGTASKHVEVTGRFTYHCTGAACAH